MTLEERETETIKALSHTVEYFIWQPPEVHRGILGQCFAILSDHYAESNALAEVTHVVGIIQKIRDRRSDREFREAFDAALAAKGLRWAAPILRHGVDAQGMLRAVTDALLCLDVPRSLSDVDRDGLLDAIVTQMEG